MCLVKFHHMLSEASRRLDPFIVVDSIKDIELPFLVEKDSSCTLVSGNVSEMLGKSFRPVDAINAINQLTAALVEAVVSVGRTRRKFS